MFNNYQELVVGMAEFYSNSLFATHDTDEQAPACNLFTPDPSGTLSTSKLDPPFSVYAPDSNGSTNNDKLDLLLSKQFHHTDHHLHHHHLQQPLLHRDQLHGSQLAAPDGLTFAGSHLKPIIGSRQLDENGTEITIGSFNALAYLDVVYIMVILFNFYLAKQYLARKLRQSTLIERLGLRAQDRERLDECIWRLIYYSFTSIWLIYTCFLKHEAQRYFNPNQIFSEYSFVVHLDEYLICMIEVAFYLHATYAIVFEDVWRRDSPMMLVHHVAAIFSVLSFYATRTHRIGLTAVVLRDTCDVLLEVTKLTMCFRIQHNKAIKSLEWTVKFFMSIFTLVFVLNQLYYYPLFCLYHALNLIKIYRLQTPVMIGILTCGLIFLILDLFWFLLILRLLYRMIFTRGPLKDLREYEEEEEEEEEEPTRVGSDKKLS